jgi:hypothetical protein
MKKPHQHKVLPVVVFSSLAPLAESPVARRYHLQLGTTTAEVRMRNLLGTGKRVRVAGFDIGGASSFLSLWSSSSRSPNRCPAQ